MLHNLMIILTGFGLALWAWISIRSVRYVASSKTQHSLVYLTFGLLALIAVSASFVSGIQLYLLLGADAAAGELLGGWFSPIAVVAGMLCVWLFTRHNPHAQANEAHTERLLREKEQTLNRLAASAYEGIYLVDPNRMQYVDVNPSGATALQYAVAEMRMMSVEQVHPGGLALMRENFQKALNGESEVRFSTEAVGKLGRRILVELSCSAIEQGGQRLVLALGRDLTRWQKSSRKIERLNQLYAMLSLSNRAITRIHERLPLLRRISEIAVDEGGFQLAWIGEIRAGKIVPLCHAGCGDGYLDNLSLTLDDAEAGSGPWVRAVAERRVVFLNNIESESDSVAWRATALVRGFRAVAAVPIMLQGSVFGVFSIYSGQPNTFDDRLGDLLDSLGEDISYALTHIEFARERVRAQSQLNKLSQAVEQSADAVMIINTNGLIEYVNPRFTELTGYGAEEAIGRDPGFLSATSSEATKYRQVLEDLARGKNWKGDFRFRKKNGEFYWSLDTVSAIRDEAGRVTHFVSTSEDYTDLRKAQDMIEQLAFYDPLTELPNRRLLQERMRQLIEIARRDRTQVAVMFLDLDKFKHVNDSMGHPSGDALLQEVASRLRAAVRGKDTVARLGGDEFTILLTDISDVSDVVATAEKILGQIKLPLQIEGQSIDITTSIGITLFPGDGEDINELLRNADLAMYHAKSLGRNNFQFYTDEINQRALGQLDLERRLRQAIEKESFVVYYQPQLDLSTGHIIGVEALVRWVNEQGEIVPPGIFIPLAEETGLIEPIGEWVLKRALLEMKALTGQLGYDVKVAVNLSAFQFKHAGRLKELIRGVLQEVGVDPAMLELELTESMLVDDVQATIETLYELRALGISLAIDDFGIGYSSLNYLKRFPIDILKIDRSFVRDIQTNPSDAAITAAIVALGHELNLKVVAEGVENDAQLQFLKEHRCDYYQGYLFSAPVAVSELLKLFRRGPLGLVANNKI